MPRVQFEFGSWVSQVGHGKTPSTRAFLIPFHPDPLVSSQCVCVCVWRLMLAIQLIVS